MHWPAPSPDMHRHAEYRDVVTELSRRLDALVATGVGFERIILDSGLGFAKNTGHNWQSLGHLPALRALGRPVLVGASCKSFLGELLGEEERLPLDHDDATAGDLGSRGRRGAHCVRVHDVPASLDAVRVAAGWRTALQVNP